MGISLNLDGFMQNNTQGEACRVTEETVSAAYSISISYFRQAIVKACIKEQRKTYQSDST
jgi:hypothetical protein